MIRRYTSYIDSQGRASFADVDAGDNAYYEFGVENVIINVGASIDDVTWTLPASIIASDQTLSGTTSRIKLNTTSVGTFKILISVTSTFGGSSITEVTPMMLKVF